MSADHRGKSRRHFAWCVVMCAFGATALEGCKEKAPPPASPPVDAPSDDRSAPPAWRAKESAPTGSASRDPDEPKAASQPAIPPLEPQARTEASGMPPRVDPHSITGSEQPAPGFRVERSDLDGITLTVPEGWIAEALDVNQQMPQLAAKAVFRLPPADGAEESAYVRVTQFREMKGKDQINLERWYGQFKQPDGRETRDVAKVENYDLGEVRVLLADISGTTTVGGEAKPDQRMLSAIVDHSRGPHFVKVLGPEKTVAQWRDSVIAYLKSAKVSADAPASRPEGN